MADARSPGAEIADNARQESAWEAAPTADEIRAAGAVLWRQGTEGLEVALIHRPRYDDWTFPKGKTEPGEHVLLTAVREVTEETGFRPVLGRPLRTIRYQRKGRPKRVDYWAATPAPDRPGQPEVGEVDKLEWLPPSSAADRLTYSHDIGLLSDLTDGTGPEGSAPGEGPGTVPFILLRHATAEPKRGWRGADLLRPLDPPGRVQAGAVAALLDCFGTFRVISSATARCVDTVLPYAAGADVTVCAEPALTIGAPADAGASRLRELLADGVPTMFCGHGETLPRQLSVLCGDLGGQPPPGPALEKGSFWVLHTRQRIPANAAGNAAGNAVHALAAIERHGA
jgi:8-oxo-(d)GTP phosphatase